MTSLFWPDRLICSSSKHLWKKKKWWIRWHLCIPVPAVQNIHVASADFKKQVTVSVSGHVNKQKFFTFWKKKCWSIYILYTFLLLLSSAFADATFLLSCQQRDAPHMRQENKHIWFEKFGSRIGPQVTFPSFFFVFLDINFAKKWKITMEIKQSRLNVKNWKFPGNLEGLAAM